MAGEIAGDLSAGGLRRAVHFVRLLAIWQVPCRKTWPATMTSTSPHPAQSGSVDQRTWQALSLRWAALHDAAAAVAALAGLAPEVPEHAVRAFPGLARDAGARRFAAVEQGVADIAAIMQPGLAALLAVNARGQDARVPALALWQEFHAARAAVLGLVPAEGTSRRSA